MRVSGRCRANALNDLPPPVCEVSIFDDEREIDELVMAGLLFAIPPMAPRALEFRCILFWLYEFSWEVAGGTELWRGSVDTWLPSGNDDAFSMITVCFRNDLMTHHECPVCLLSLAVCRINGDKIPE